METSKHYLCFNVTKISNLSQLCDFIMRVSTNTIFFIDKISKILFHFEKNHYDWIESKIAVMLLLLLFGQFSQ